MRVWLTALVLLLVTSRALAQQAPDPAVTAFQEGVRLLDAHSYREAAAAFQRSLALRDSPTARYNLALAYRGGRMVRQSIEALRLFLADPSGTPQQMVDDAAHVLGEQERLLAHVTLRISGPPPTQILVDGETVAPVATQILDLDPGHHVFTANARDRAPVVVERDLAEGAREDVTVDISAAEDRLAHLEIRAAPTTSAIAIDDVVRSHGAYAADVDPGTYRVSVSAPGHTSAERRITLGAAQHLTIDMSLAPLQTGGDGSTWLWLGVGITAVVAGTIIAVLAAVLTSTPWAPLDGGSTGVIAMALR